MSKDLKDTKTTPSEGLWFYIKGVLTWERVTGIITIIGLIISIVTILPESKSEKLKREIRQKIEIVEKNFNPEELIQEKDSSTYVALLVDFQQKILDYCVLWQTMDNPRPYIEYSYMKKNDIDSLIISEMCKIDTIDHIWDDITEIQKNILHYTDSIGVSNYPFLSISKVTLLGKYGNQRENLESDLIKKFTPKLELYKTAQGEDKERYLKAALEEIDNFRDNPDCYLVVNLSLEYWIELNKLLKVWKRDILKLENERKMKN